MQARQRGWAEGTVERPPAIRASGWLGQAMFTAAGVLGKDAGDVGVLLLPPPLIGSKAGVDNDG